MMLRALAVTLSLIVSPALAAGPATLPALDNTNMFCATGIPWVGGNGGSGTPGKCGPSAPAYPGSANAFTADNSFAGTTDPTMAAGSIFLYGSEATAPTMSANGEGAIYLGGASGTTNGLTLQGKGSTNDFTLQNDAGSTACALATGTTTFNCGGLAIGGTALTALATAAVGQIPGTATNNNASAGNVGEYITSSDPGLVDIAAQDTPQTITSISLTAGDWDVSIDSYVGGGSTTNVQYAYASLVTTTNTISTAAGFIGILGTETTPFSGGNNVTLHAGPTRVSLASTTTYYYTTQAHYSISTMGAGGIIHARRVR